MLAARGRNAVSTAAGGITGRATIRPVPTSVRGPGVPHREESAETIAWAHQKGIEAEGGQGGAVRIVSSIVNAPRW